MYMYMCVLVVEEAIVLHELLSNREDMITMFSMYSTSYMYMYMRKGLGIFLEKC